MPGRRWRGGCGRPAASSAMTGSCRAAAVRDHWACWPHLRVRAGRRGQQAAPDGSTPRQHCRRFGIVTAGAGSGGRVIRAHLLSFKTEASRAAPGASVLIVGSGMRLTVGRTAPGGIGKPVHFDRRPAGGDVWLGRRVPGRSGLGWPAGGLAPAAGCLRLPGCVAPGRPGRECGCRAGCGHRAGTAAYPAGPRAGAGRGGGLPGADPGGAGARGVPGSQAFAGAA